jgi:hypothetical protein
VGLNYADPSNLIGFPKSRHEGRLTGKGTIGKKAITPDSHLFRCAHFHVLQQMSIISEYLDEHKKVLLRDNPRRYEAWLANEHMRKFTGWLRDRISQSSDTKTSEYLKKLAHGSILTVVTYQGYQNSDVRVDVYDVMGQDKNMYYGQMQEVWELDFHGFKIPLFRCKWVDAIKGVV